MDKIIDLHIHSNLSDGTLSPKEIIEEACKNSVSIISITDHDTLEAHTSELYEYAKSKGIEIIPGVEISTKLNGKSIHVLGYDLDVNNTELKEKLKVLINVRYDYLYRVSSKLEELGYKVNIDKLSKIDIVTKGHIALDVINNKDNEKLLLELFEHIPTMGEFIELIMNEGCPAYVKKETITPKEASKLIKNAGGKVVLAHPMAYVHEDNLSEEDILKIVTDMNADGIEANYLYIDRNNNKINEIKKWNEFASRNNLIVTTGSDFHNKDGIRPEIGFVNEPNIYNSIYGKKEN